VKNERTTARFGGYRILANAEGAKTRTVADETTTTFREPVDVTLESGILFGSPWGTRIWQHLGRRMCCDPARIRYHDDDDDGDLFF
jgi:hypothetical protein